jgi:hypothetical protein
MRVRNHGKYTHMRKNNPRGIATCDYSGMMVAHKDLKPQYQYRGQGLVNTGFLVNPKFLDEPNPQDLTPLIKADPVPLINPRPDSVIGVPPQDSVTITLTGNLNMDFQTYSQNSYFTFVGDLSANTIIFVPGAFHEFFVTNNVNAAGNILSIQVVDNFPSRLVLQNNQTVFLCSDGFTLSIIQPN